MSAPQVTEHVMDELTSNPPDFLCLNFANPDMVGHTGVYKAIVQAVETVDSCLEKIVNTGLQNGYTFIVIADHGNADLAINNDGTPHTAHSLNLVPCIVVSSAPFKALNNGILGDIAPTILDLFEVEKPKEMTGKPLIII